MASINTIINNISNQSVSFFFENKITSFKPEKEVFVNTVQEETPYSDPVKIGHAELKNHEELLVFTCEYNKELTARSAKKQQFEIAKRVLKEDFKDGAIFIFYDVQGNFRFSFIRRNYGEKTSKYSNWKRYTYYIEPGKNNKTFKNRIENCTFNSLDEIQNAFSVEPLSKQFYKDLSYWYFWSLKEIQFPNDQNENEEVLKANAMIRLITRVMFVWFMKQKKLVPNELFDKSTLEKLLNYNDSTGSTYYKAILQNLFFATLSTPKEKNRKFVTSQYGVQNFFRYKRFIKDENTFLKLMDDIPFLNGGLFENLDIVKPEENIDIRIDCFSENKKNEKRLVVPDYLFFGEHTADVSQQLNNDRLNNVQVIGLIDLLNRYDFTIDENTPYDQEVALDPELLGLVFENLLASYNPESQDTARRESGSFYTPREIVDYMVEESLVQNIKSKTNLDEEKLRLLFTSDKEQPFDALQDKKAIIQSISQLKILDPACGSGAFPMGALQKMTHILSKLDEDNSIWFDTQKQIAIEETIEAYESKNDTERKTRLAAIEEAFAKGQNEPDYARKLYLIENCLYGVDIQPIAMQIAKLRFFISLLVEQKINPEKENFGIIALPNLETKFVAANTLKSLPGKMKTGQSYTLKNPEIEELEKQLEKVRDEHFNARTPKTKKKKRALDNEIRQKIADLLISDGFPNETAQAILKWNPYNTNSSSTWFDPEWMFGLEAFDIVIGNPPYIQLQKALPGDSKLKYGDLYKEEGYSTFARTGDIYGLFYEQGLNITKNKGLLCYITSNKWMRAGYGKKLREYLSKKKPLVLLDLGPGIFEAATVDVNIIIIENSKVKDHNLKAKVIRDKTQIDHLADTEFTALKNLGEDSWVVLSPIEQSIKEKIERIGTPLKDWDIDIYRGVLTGYNTAFIIDGQKRKELIEQDPKSAEIIRPILRGRDIKKYGYDFADLWLINTHNGIKEKGVKPIDVKDYPTIKQHLDQYYDKLAKRTDKGVTPYNLRNCAYMEDFYKQKIMYSEIVREPQFYLDNRGEYFPEATTFIITGEFLEYLYNLLHSKAVTFFFKKFYAGGGLGDEGYRYKKAFLENLPIPKPADDKLNPNNLDENVFKIYKLNMDEINFIMNQ